MIEHDKSATDDNSWTSKHTYTNCTCALMAMCKERQSGEQAKGGGRGGAGEREMGDRVKRKKSGKHMNLEPIFYWHNIIGKVAVQKVGWKGMMRKMHVIHAAAPTGNIYSRKNKLTSSRNFGNKKNLSEMASNALVNIFWSNIFLLVARILPAAATIHS